MVIKKEGTLKEPDVKLSQEDLKELLLQNPRYRAVIDDEVNHALSFQKSFLPDYSIKKLQELDRNEVLKLHKYLNNDNQLKFGGWEKFFEDRNVDEIKEFIKNIKTY